MNIAWWPKSSAPTGNPITPSGAPICGAPVDQSTAEIGRRPTQDHDLWLLDDIEGVTFNVGRAGDDLPGRGAIGRVNDFRDIPPSFDQRRSAAMHRCQANIAEE